ncbi:ABC transporter ATP-binding protein [Rhizobium mesoamericanum]|uniref:Leucine/isoleucine/valine transporter subunit ATP-binding component of ABC superfamily n=1 Tax=Rhizobium mesoamericanum STM3625 TaxID=1211777 RepID=K0Q498_9HYPH|nr:ABC transporter ATP-binding protein [Rhizobium mesoamericanum]CCM79925.1 leucine/isoleucine/valine transporter subunit; ATP-binding component of ABC superfamily [Rhizobium mesoamericanum STM3625]
MVDASSDEILLRTRGLTKSFRGLIALRDHQIDLRKGEIVGVIGPNGSGKSTLFNCITGFSKPTAGEVFFRHDRISGLRPSAVVAKGLARTFQGSRLFVSLTVRENVRAAAHLRHQTNIFEAVLLTRRYFGTQEAATRQAEELLSLVGLSHQADRLACELPYGDQRRLEIARALATAPDILLLDEPAAGLDSAETKQLADLIRRIRDSRGVTVVVVEHDMDLIMNLCERIQVLAAGEVICVGTPQEVRAHPRVREAYLGHE